MEKPFQFEPKKIKIYEYTLKSSVERYSEVRDLSEPPMQPINGSYPDSIEEWRLAVALWKLEIPFIYQFRIFENL